MGEHLAEAHERVGRHLRQPRDRLLDHRPTTPNPNCQYRNVARGERTQYSRICVGLRDSGVIHRPLVGRSVEVDVVVRKRRELRGLRDDLAVAELVSLYLEVSISGAPRPTPTFGPG